MRTPLHVAPLEQLQHMQAGAAAQHRGRHLAGPQAAHLFDEQVGQPRGRAQADLAAAGAIAVFRHLARDGGEVLAAEHARQGRVGTRLALRQHIGAGAFGHA